MPPGDRKEGMKMRGGQGARVSTTKALIAFDPNDDGRAVQPHMVDASTFVFASPEEGELSFACAYGLKAILALLDPDGKKKAARIYARLSSPSVEAVQKTVLALEPRSKWSLLFPSGMAATLTLVQSVCHMPYGGKTALGKVRRDVILYGRPVYGGTHALMETVVQRWGFRAVSVDLRDLNDPTEKIKEHGNRVGLVFCETPANPTMAMVDIRAISDLLTKMYNDPAVRPVFAVDNTFAGIFQHPLLLGADVCVYSATKYMGGHSDLIGGVLVGRDGPMCVVKDFVEGIAETDVKAACMLYRAILGYTPAPEMAYKLFKHLQTYILRMRKQTLNAIFIAEWLAEHKKVSKVYYPTLLTGEEARLYRRQMSGPSAMIAFELKDCTKEAAFRFLKALNVILRAVSLGFVRSLAEHANTMTHSDIPPEDQLKMGITPGLIRLSIGLEEPEDIVEDLERALAEV